MIGKIIVKSPASAIQFSLDSENTASHYVQREEYGMDVLARIFLQPAAQQVERVQSDEYGRYVYVW